MIDSMIQKTFFEIDTNDEVQYLYFVYFTFYLSGTYYRYLKEK